MYSFKRETTVLVQVGSNVYDIPIYPDFSFSQSFREGTRPQRTLHSPTSYFDGAFVTEALPANFSITTPTFNILHTLLLEASAFTLYFVTSENLYKITPAVIESCNYSIRKGDVIVLAFSGTGGKLEVLSTSAPAVTHPSDLVYHRNLFLDCRVSGVSLGSVISANLDMTNRLNWLPPTRVQERESRTAVDTAYPSQFNLTGKTLSGNIQQYILEDAPEQNTWRTGTSVYIGSSETPGIPQLEFDIPHAVFTSRISTTDIYTKSYDFRMTSSPSDLSTIIRGDF